MKGVDLIEYYVDDSDKFIAFVESSMVPAVGEIVNIKGKEYEVLARKFAVDNADDWTQVSHRCCVEITPRKKRNK